MKQATHICTVGGLLTAIIWFIVDITHLVLPAEITALIKDLILSLLPPFLLVFLAWAPFYFPPIHFPDKLGMKVPAPRARRCPEWLLSVWSGHGAVAGHGSMPAKPQITATITNSAPTAIALICWYGLIVLFSSEVIYNSPVQARFPAKLEQT